MLREFLREHGSRSILLVVVGTALCTSPVLADEGSDPERVHELGTVTVTAGRPTSLPTQIPTTIEGITGGELATRINATDAEDALKYFPSLTVRKRYIGDYDHAVLASRASGTGNSARSLVYADGILLSNLLGNGATYTPRWGLVTPEQIERVDVLYGPFSAAYPGNSVGAVVDYTTRMPERFEAIAKLARFSEGFKVYGTDARYAGWQASAAVGDRSGGWSWWLDFNRLDSDAHPIGFANKLLVNGVAGNGGVPVTGAVAARNPRNQDWLILGATGQTHTVQDQAKLKVARDLTPTLRASYTFGWWHNDAARAVESYLRDAAGHAVYGGTINVDGRQYALAASDFSPSRGRLTHLIHGLSLKSNTRGNWDYELAASRYDYATDLTRSPAGALPDAGAGGAGRITDQHGTGWTTLALRGVWRPQGPGGTHLVDFGAQRDDYRLRTLVSNAADWQLGVATTRVSAFRGDTDLTSLYLQDTWRLANDWRATLGARLEQWRAHDGALSDATSTLAFGTRRGTWLSPKAALAWQVNGDWELKASLGRAVRMPTVAELYQGSIASDAIVNNDPDLGPERSWTSELTAERAVAGGSLRHTLFFEDTRDALYSQTNATVTPSVTSIQNVGHIRTVGVEASWTLSDVWLPGLDLSASLTWARSRIEANANFPASVGKWQPRVPQWRANAVASYAFGGGWFATLGGRYSGRQYNTLDNVDTHAHAYTGNSAFLVFDARLRRAFGERWSATLGIDNLGNEHYWAFHPYTQRNWIAELAARF
jgi:iron complex outermembrane receptor protein